MDDAEPRPADLAHNRGHVIATFRRAFDHPAAAVWAALTDPAILPQWLAPGTIDLRKGGAARLAFQDSGIVIDSEVSACDHERLLAYSWSGPGEPMRSVCWDLLPRGAGCALILTLEIPEDEDAARACAGWEAHLDMLAAALEGVPIHFPFERFKAARQAYGERLAEPA